jgi:hypothetical protein
MTQQAEHAVQRNEAMYSVPQRLHGSGDGIKGGFVAGAIAGGALLLYVGLASPVVGFDVWLGPKIAAAPWLGARVLAPGFDPTALVLGLACHFAVAGLWGMLFGAFFYGATPGSTVALGALWGALVWLAMFYLVLPLFGVGQLATLIPAGAAAFQHTLFGLALAAAYLPFQRARRVPRLLPL